MALLSCNGVFERLPNGSRLTLDLLAPRHRDRLFSPRAQRLRVVEEVGGHLVILHDLPMLGVRAEWAHAARLEVGAIGLIHLQVERVIGDQGDKAIAGVGAQAYAFFESRPRQLQALLRQHPVYLQPAWD